MKQKKDIQDNYFLDCINSLKEENAEIKKRINELPPELEHYKRVYNVNEKRIKTLKKYLNKTQ